jgi:hypothetical protein
VHDELEAVAWIQRKHYETFETNERFVILYKVGSCLACNFLYIRRYESTSTKASGAAQAEVLNPLLLCIGPSPNLKLEHWVLKETMSAFRLTGNDKVSVSAALTSTSNSV